MIENKQTRLIFSAYLFILSFLNTLLFHNVLAYQAMEGSFQKVAISATTVFLFNHEADNGKRSYSEKEMKAVLIKMG